jgi:hypothetical protein
MISSPISILSHSPRRFLLDENNNSKKYYSSSYPSYKSYWNSKYSWNNEYKNFQYRRKCAYIMAVISPEKFMSLGALKEDELYILKRNYDGTFTGETCAVIGVNKKNIKELLNKDSNIYEKLKHTLSLKDVPGIEDLSPYNLTVLQSMLKFLYFVKDNELILFNIEPKGLTPKDKQIYPCANVSFPGGGLEYKDECCYEKGAWREFEEETGISCPCDLKNMKYITKQKFTFSDRQAIFYMCRL